MHCATCGKPLHGVELFIKGEWQCAECAQQPTNAMFCRGGDTARYAFPEQGSVAARVMADKHLHVGETYTVDRVQVHGHVTYLHFETSPYWYNSTLFERVAE